MTETPAPAAPPRRNIPGWLWALIGLGGLVALAFCAIVVIGVLSLLGQRTTPTVITSSDGLTQVEVPGGWREMDDLNDEADLQVANGRREQYLVVLTESKEDFADADLEDYAELISGNISDGVEDSVVSGPEALEVQGQPALQYRIEGTIDNINVVYWVTAVEGADHLHQVIAWTLSSQADENEPVLKEVINSFREVGN